MKNKLDTKAELYKTIIDFQKQHGQGLSGIVKLGNGGAEIGKWLDELIEEGLIEACDTGGSLGHKETNIFYMPTKGYNVWKDEGTDGVYDRHKGRYLTHVRYYLGALEKETNPTNTDTQNILNPSFELLSRNPDYMKNYTEWLERNHTELQEMLKLDDYYDEPNIEFSETEITWIKSKKWYEDNLTIQECIVKSNEYQDGLVVELNIHNQLVECYKTDNKKYKNDLEKTLKDIEDNKSQMLERKKLHKWFDKQNLSSKIQSCIK